MNVTVIGQGYVGLTLAVFAADHFNVVGFDNNPSLVAQLNSGMSHIEGISKTKLTELIGKRKYRATTDARHLSDSDIVLIAVPTPLDINRDPDLKFIDSACKTIGENVTKRILIINESTSYPGTLRDFIKPRVEKYSVNKIAHLYAVSPERVDPGREDFNQKNTPRLYSGLTKEASQLTANFYASFCDNLVEVSSPEVAETAKLFENTFRQVNIALVNELAQITHAIGVDVFETLNAANTKPYGFMKFTPSAGVGGHCIPVDPTYLASVAENSGVPATFIRRANEVNRSMSTYVVDRVEKDFGGSLTGKRILIIGVSYKSNISDCRETPAELVIDELRKRGASVSWHDEIVKSWRGEKSTPLSPADICIVLTRHATVMEQSILKVSPYVFDTTGTVNGAIHL